MPVTTTRPAQQYSSSIARLKAPDIGPAMRSARSLRAWASTRITFSPILCIGLLASRAALSNIFFHDFLPLALSPQNEFDRVAECAISAAVLGHIVSITLNFIASIGHGNG